MTMVPTLVASSIGVNWTSSRDFSERAHFNPPRSSATPWQHTIEMHSSKKDEVPVYERWGKVTDSPTPTVHNIAS